MCTCHYRVHLGGDGLEEGIEVRVEGTEGSEDEDWLRFPSDLCILANNSDITKGGYSH